MQQILLGGTSSTQSPSWSVWKPHVAVVDQAEFQPQVKNVHTTVGEQRGYTRSASVCHTVKAAREQQFAPKDGTHWLGQPATCPVQANLLSASRHPLGWATTLVSALASSQQLGWSTMLASSNSRTLMIDTLLLLAKVV